MIRWLLYRFIPFYFILTALLAGLMLLFSETGLNWVWQQAHPHLPQGVEIDSVQGRLLGRIQLSGIHVDNPQMQLDIEQAWLDWSPWALFGARVQINQINLIGLRYQAGEAPPAPDDEPKKPLSELPSLPDIDLRLLRLRDIQVVQQGQAVFHLHRAQLSAKMRDQALDIHLKEFKARDFGQWQAQLQAQINPDQINLHTFSLSSPDAPDLALSLAGQCQWPTLACQLSADWKQLRWPLDSQQWHSPQGKLQVQRDDNSLQANLGAELKGEQLPVSRLKVQAKLPANGSRLNWTANWQAQPSESQEKAAMLDLNGDYQLDTSKLNADLSFQQLDASWWLADWPTNLDGQMAMTGQIQPALQLRSKNIHIQGLLRGEPFDARLNGHWNGMQDWALGDTKISWAGNQLTAELNHRSTWNGQVELKAPALAQLDPQLDGQINAQVQLSGQQSWPMLDWTLNAEALQVGELELDSVDSQGQFHATTLNQQLTLTNLHGYGVLINELSVTSQGSPENAKHQLELDESRASAHLQLSSQWNSKTQRLDLSLDSGKLQLGPRPRQSDLAWVLQQPGALSWHDKQLNVEQQCWHSGVANSCLSLGWQDEKLAATFDLQQYPLARLQTQLPHGTSIDGDVAVKLEVQPSPLSQLDAQLRLSNNQIDVQVQQAQESLNVLSVLPGQLNAHLQDEQLEAKWSFPVAGNAANKAGLEGFVTLDAEQQLQGELALALDDLSIISALSPEVLRSSGQLTGQWNLSGTQSEPSLAGQLQVQQAEIDLDKPNLRLRDIKLSLTANADQPVTLDASLQSGEGTLTLNGQWHWKTPQQRLQARVQGSNFLAVDTAEAHVLVSPDLTLEAQLPDISLRGRIDIPQASIQPRKLNQASSAITPVSDQRIVGQDKPLEESLRIDSEIALVLGDDVSFEGLGLSTQLGGRLLTRMKPGQVATGVGDLRLIDGHYKAYGQDLQIEKGRLIFSGGPITEPGLDIKAYRQANPDVRAGVIVRGPITKPEVSLYSDPSMRETDQLSYLILGRAAESKNENDQAVLNNAALALGLKGSDFLAKRFKSKLGLDEVSIGAQPGQESSQASLVLGKYLSPDIYVSYGIGLFEPIYTFKLRYRLSSKWSLQTESGVESGGDLFYTIER